MSEAVAMAERTITVTMETVVRFCITKELDAFTRIANDDWRNSFWELSDEDDVLDMWADNCIRNNVSDVSELDGWADIPEGAITMCVLQTEDFERQP